MRIMVAGVALLLIVLTSPSFAQIDSFRFTDARRYPCRAKGNSRRAALNASYADAPGGVGGETERCESGPGASRRERSNLIQIQADQGRTLGELDRAQDKADHSSDPVEQKRLTEEVQRLKTKFRHSRFWSRPGSLLWTKRSSG